MDIIGQTHNRELGKKKKTPKIYMIISPYGYFKGTWEYLMNILCGLKYLTEEISFRKNNLQHLTPHV